MKIDKRTAELAMIIFRKIEKNWERYEADCDESYKQGYRPSHCFHGRSLWTENDIPCGYCEDLGYYTFNRQAYREMALGEAKQAVKEMDERVDLLVKLNIKNAPINTMELNGWVWEPLTKLGYVKK